MAFQSPSVDNQQQQHLQSQVQYGQASLDSITLGQLKNMVNAPPKPKQQHYDFRYEDEDNLFEEINEFYAFVEADLLGENLRVWQGSFDGAWTQLSQAERKAYIVTLLENLEHVDSLVRYSASRRLLYLLQGNFAESTSPEHQMHWIIENAKLVRASEGITVIVDSLKMLSVKHEQLMTISDADLARIQEAPHLRQSWIEEVLAEISMCLGMLYPIIEVFRSDEEFAEELMNMEPPLPVYFLSLMSNLSNRSAKSYPAKKLLLVTWKVLLACLGGMAEQARAKSLARELAGLPPMHEEVVNIKSTPVDLQMFREETFVKYPTFSPPPPVESNGLPSVKLAEALNSLPVRNHYVHPEANVNNNNGPGSDDPSNSNSVLNNGYSGRQGMNMHQQGAPFPGNGPMAATPAPSPPPSPKPKKQQYQTDQTKPFVLPFSITAPTPKSLVPYAIAEADELYGRHMYISLGLFQTWRTREDFILDESGLREMPGDKEEDTRMKRWSVVKAAKGVIGDPGNQSDFDEEEDEKVTWPDSKVLEEAIERAEQELKTLDTQGDAANKAERKRAKQRRDDLLRIQRVETIYAATLPFLSGYIVVVLKFLIAINNITSVQANQNQQNQQQHQQQPTSGFFLHLGQSLDPPPPPPQQHHSPEEIDALRHREIMIKGLSAFLLLLLKWFKRSHIMKYQHLAFTLLSAGTHVHILRLLTYTEVATYVVTKNEVPERTFFRYCYEHFSPNAAHVPADQFPILAPRQPTSVRPPQNASSSNVFSIATAGAVGGAKGDEEIEMITDFSWRNFFAVINVVKIMHKITKSNPTRIQQLVHHKTSAILKRMMRISHPVLQLQLLKLIKSQVPYSGRKWKQLNMKLITAIYLNCRPELRDEWLATIEIEESKDSPTNVETFLRRLVAFYDYKRYGYIPPKVNSEQHQRSASLSIADPPLSPELHIPNPLASPSTSEVFPPLRSQAADPAIFMPYPSEDLAFEAEYEEYLFDLHAGGGPGGFTGQAGAGGPMNLDMVTTDRAPSWSELPNDRPIGAGISDSESVVSIGDGLVADFTDGKAILKEDTEVGKNDWAHMSPKTLGALPKSPAKSPAGGGRRSSSGGGLRPVIPFDLDDSEGSALEDEDDAAEMGPMPIERSTPFDSGKGVDEVEYMYGE